MVEELAEDKNLGQWFDGHKARVRCFLHILNLVAKSLIRQFDADADADKEKAERNTAEEQLEALARGLENCIRKSLPSKFALIMSDQHY